MARYVGKRIVPKHCGYWDNTKEYEMESVVYDQASGNSYISRKTVPVGTDISQTEYWALCSDFNMQMDLLEKHFTATEQRIVADNDATAAEIRQDNDQTEAAIRNDNVATKEYLDGKEVALTETVNSARNAMTQQKNSFDQTAAALNARMDEVLAAGTGDGATEVADARVDTEGNAFDSLGSHIRSVTERLKSDFESIENNVTDQSLWTQGALNGLTGAEATSSTRIKTGYIPTYITDLIVSEGYGITIFCYSKEDDTFSGTWTGTTAAKADPSTTFTGNVSLIKLQTYKIRIHAKKLTNASVTPADDYACVGFVRYTDATLTKTAIPADAKTTGDAIKAVESEMLDVTQPFVKLTKDSDIFDVEEGYYATTGNKTALSGYVLCSYTADIDFQIYADATTLAGTVALFVTIYNTSIASGNNVACYKRTTQENTLPTEANKATVYAGQILAISIYTPTVSPADFGIYANYQKQYTFNSDINLADSQIEQIVEDISDDFTGKVTNFAYNKKIAWFGDSISQLKSLPHIVGSLLGANVIDCSIKGSTIGVTYSNFDAFAFYNLVSAIISGSFTSQESQYDAYTPPSGGTKLDIRENLDHIEQTDFSTVDYVVLLQGTNDFGIQMYTIETDLSSASRNYAFNGYFCYDQKRYKVTSAISQGSAIVIGTNCELSIPKIDVMHELMDDAISRFITAYPSIKFFIISPPFRKSPTEDQFGNTLAQYIEVEKEVAEKYAIPFYDLLTHSRICDENKTTYMLSDSGVYVHPNDYGDAWLAELCAKFILTN